MPDRKVVATLKASCPKCQAALVVVEPGSETARLVTCPTCNDYLYYVGSVAYCGTLAFIEGLTKEALQEIKQALGSAQLLPEVIDRINAITRRWGLNVDGGTNA